MGPDRHVEPAEPVPPAQSVEPSTTEPKAASRDAAHHGRGSEPSDDWHDEIEDGPDVGINPATGLPNTRHGMTTNRLLDSVRGEVHPLGGRDDAEGVRPREVNEH